MNWSMEHYDQLFKDLANQSIAMENEHLQLAEKIKGTGCPYLIGQMAEAYITTSSDSLTNYNDREINHG